MATKATNKQIVVVYKDAGKKKIYSIVTGTKDNIVETKNGSKIYIDAEEGDINQLDRKGNDLVVYFVDKTIITINDFFDCPAQERAQLYLGHSENKADARAVFADDENSGAGICFVAGDTGAAKLQYVWAPTASSGGTGALLPILGGLGLAGAAAGAAGGGGGSGSSPAPIPPADTTAPAPPVIVSVGDDAMPLVGTVANGGVTNDRTPTISGTAEAGATITISDGANRLGTTTADQSGNWTFTPAANLSDGVYRLSATATDRAGNVSAPSSVYQITVDTVAPSPPTVDATDGTLINGTAEPSTQIALDLDDDGDTDATVPVGEDGKWTFKPVSPLPQGATVGAVAVDKAGNRSEPAKDKVPDINDAPVAVDSVATTAEDTPATLTPSVTDPDTGDTRTYSDITLSAGGTVTVNPNGTFSYTPAANFTGTETISYRVTDAGGLSDTATITVTVTPVNDAPVATNSTATTAEDTPATLTPSVTDADTGDTRTYSDITLSAGGTVTVNPNGTFSYTPAANFTGTETISYRVTDAGGLSDTATITVTVTPVNDAPVAVDDNRTTAEDSSLVVAAANGLLANDTDVDNAAAQLQVTAGTFTTTQGGTIVIAANGGYTYTPLANFSGADTVTYTVRDTAGLTDTGVLTITVTPVNDAPVAIDDTATVLEGATLVVAAANGLLANDTDVDNTAAQLQATAGTFTTAQGGTITISADGSYSYTARANFAGVDTVSYSIRDTAGLTDIGLLSVTVTPLAPVVTIDTDSNNDGILSAAEIDGVLVATVSVKLPLSAVAGDQINLSDGTSTIQHTLIASEITAGRWTTTVPLPDNGDTLSVTATLKKAGGPTSAAATDAAVVNLLEAVNDAQSLATGNLTATISPTVNSQDTQVLGVVEAADGTDGSQSFTLDGDYSIVRVEVSQQALVAVADAYRVDVINAAGQIVASTDPGDAANTVGQVLTPIIGSTLGISGANTIVAEFAGLAAGAYRVVVRNDASQLTDLLDANGANGVSLQELGDSGVLLGPENQDVVLDTVTDALDGQGLIAGINFGTLGTLVVRPLLEIVLNDIVANASQETPVSALTGIIGDILSSPDVILPVGVNAGQVLDAVIGEVAQALLSNTLTLLQQTDISTQITEYNYALETASGNVITDNDGIAPNGTDTIGSVGPTRVTSIRHGSKTISVDAINGAELAGDYGILRLQSNGSYQYFASGNPESIGKTEVFTYTLADDVASDTATLSISLVDSVAPSQTPAITALSFDTGTAGDWNTADGSPTILGTLNSRLLPGEKVQVRIDSGDWNDATVYGANGRSWFYGPDNLAAGNRTVTVRIVDQSGNVGANTDSQPIVINLANRAPTAAIDSGTLSGLVSAGTLGLANVGDQALVAFDPDQNLTQVTVRFDPLVGLGINRLTWSSAIATELGLSVAAVHNELLLNTLDSTLTITKSGGGAISNEAVNELLRTVHLQSVLSASVAVTTSITATDASSATSGTVSVSGLANVGLLNTNALDPAILLGTANADVIEGSSLDENLYGFAGNDILNGLDGNDLLRGGAGADRLSGGDGNDVLIFDALDTLIDGGVGFDTVLVENGTASFSLARMDNIERVLVTSTQSVTALLTEAGIISATDADNELIINGDDNLQITLQGAIYKGQVLIDNIAYEHYTLGRATVYIEDPVGVILG